MFWPTLTLCDHTVSFPTDFLGLWGRGGGVIWAWTFSLGERGEWTL